MKGTVTFIPALRGHHHLPTAAQQRSWDLNKPVCFQQFSTTLLDCYSIFSYYLF